MWQSQDSGALGDSISTSATPGFTLCLLAVLHVRSFHPLPHPLPTGHVDSEEKIPRALENKAQLWGSIHSSAIDSLGGTWHSEPQFPHQEKQIMQHLPS